ncbi:MAG TPA: DUF4339 domain-containing protein [bacterium]|nr:DUF4339 domain-containing protein [bacterium]
MKKLDDENLLGLIKSKETCPPDELAAAMEEISLRKLMPENEIQLIKDCNEKKWYYEKSGKRNGPVTTFQISVLIKDETISFTTSVWKKDFENWKPISETDLKQYFTIKGPPPLLGDKVNNTFIWLLAFAPIFGTIIEGMFFQEVSFKRTMIFWIILNSCLAIIDDMSLEKAGHRTNNLGWAMFCVPIYIWRRASLTHQSKSYFWVWIVTVIASLFIDSAVKELGNQLEVRKNAQQLFEKVWPFDGREQESLHLIKQVFAEQGNVFVIDSQNEISQITSSGKDTSPIISPDGKDVYFVRKTGVFGEAEYEEVEKLMIMKTKIDSLEEEIFLEKTDGIEIFEVRGLSITANGKHLLFITQKWSTSGVLLRINVNTKKIQEITHADNFEILKKGEYENHLIVNRSSIKEDVGREWSYWLIDIDGNVIKEIGDEESVQKFKEKV